MPSGYVPKSGPELMARFCCVPMPVTATGRLPPFDVMLTAPVAVPMAVGVNLTTTEYPQRLPRLKFGGLGMLYGGVAVMVPVSVPPPTFHTVRVRSAKLPRFTTPKSDDDMPACGTGSVGDVFVVHKSASWSFRNHCLYSAWTAPSPRALADVAKQLVGSSYDGF